MKRVLLLVGFTVVSLFFFASDVFGADGFGAGATGGAGGATVTVDSSAADLKYYAESDLPYIIQVSGTVDLIEIGGKLRIRSNKTIRGVGPNPTIIGNTAFQQYSSNVIIEELNFTNPSSYGEGDGITVKYATDIFITKCTFYDCWDGCLDISRESDYVTVSWCKFYFTVPNLGNNNRVTLVGGGDGDTSDMGKLHLTFHHNWYGSYCIQRIPSVRFGRAHIYNNYYNCPGNDYCILARLYSECLIENNYFDHIEDPYSIYITSGDDGKIKASGNIFESCTGYTDPGDDDVFTPPYSYTLDSAGNVPVIVMASAGAGMGPPPRRINPLDGACGVSTDVILSWATELNADSYDVYFGTNFDDVNDATTASAEYMGRYDANSYYPGELEESTAYYWRIDDVNLSDPCSPYKGDVWTFTTLNVYYVDANATGDNDGSSWEDAFNHLQDALSVASECDEIRVAEGVYKPDEDTDHPDGSGARDATFQLINGLAIYGGFPSGGGQWHERDPNAYETILSGDLMGNDGPDFANNGENSYHVVTGSGTSKTAVLDGFTITAGNADGPEQYAQNMGGGMFNYNGNTTLANCAFIGNSAGYSGGMFSYYNSNPTLTNCMFSDNSGDIGGGMFNYYNSSPTLTNCMFSDNSGGYIGGGMVNYYNSNPTLTSCAFSGNQADEGGGMCNLYNSSTTLTNCTFSGNSSTWDGGGMWNVEQSNLTLTNCILWGNTAPSGPQIYNDGTSSATVSYSDVQGGWPGTGNINLDPLFIDASNGDLHLLSGSPCINTGDPNYVAGPNETDLDGLPRVIGGRIDMGAYEFNHQPVADAGPNQIAYAWIDGFADVNLDGSASYDDDNDVLDYYWSWTIDGNDYKANGVSPTISLPVGEHTIELVVDDGSDESEPNYCTIEVIAPLQARLLCIPCTLNWKTCCRGKLITLISMPRGIRKADIDLTEPLIFYPGQIESQRQFAYELGHRWHRRTYVWASFDKSACIEHLEPGFNKVNIVGKLTSGRYYDAAGYLRLVLPKRWHRWWPYPVCHGRK